MSTQTLQTPKAKPGKAPKEPMSKRNFSMLFWFLGPAIIILVIMIIYPAIYSVVRSMFDDDGNFVFLGNYIDMFSLSSTRTALKNNLIWVLVAPFITTTLGLIFAVLMDKIKWKTAFRLIIFMPMAISMLAAGIIFRSIFQQNPEIGFANATVVAAKTVLGDDAAYPGARPRAVETFQQADDGAITSLTPFSPGDVVNIGMVGVKADATPEGNEDTFAAEATPTEGAISGTVWLDFSKGGGGQANVIDPNEVGLHGMEVEALDANGKVVKAAKANDDGTFVIEGLADGQYTLRLPAANFAEITGVNWLGKGLITPVMILAFLWIWAGFAMVMIGAGLSAVDRSLMEAARVDGANELQVFRHITVPQLMPTVTVVLVTLTINVLKIFDLVYVIPPGESKEAGTVVAVEMWKQFGNYNYGMGSTLAILLLLMVLPFMLYQVRNFRKGN